MKNVANTSHIIVTDSSKDNLTNQSVEKAIVKVSAMWHFVADYLEMLKFTGAICDEVFSCI